MDFIGTGRSMAWEWAVFMPWWHLGYSMVYGIVQLINFAHGDIIMVAAYIILHMFHE